MNMGLSTELQEQIIAQNKKKEQSTLGKHAFYSYNATRRTPEIASYRPPFTRDADRILHSLSFARFFDKTQVFFWVKSDVHQHRMLHVQLVSKIAREIANAIKLNEDLVEAMALGHDIGHPPFGHDGEVILNNLAKKHGIGNFLHNYESVWFLQEIEMQNLSLPVLDGILCHNGENHHRKLEPNRGQGRLTWADIQKDMEGLYNKTNLDPIPKTLEGCLVRFVDTISYISRDVMDAENLGFLKFSAIPENVKKTLGKSNRDIINTLITDLIRNSINRDYISYSEDVFNALQDLYQFNYDNIYTLPEKMKPLPEITKAFNLLWDHYYEDLIKQNKSSKIYTDHIELNLKQIKTRIPNIDSIAKYPYAQQPPEIIVRDFIAGMTDQYFWELAKNIDPTIKFEANLIY
jgi:dGTPase